MGGRKRYALHYFFDSFPEIEEKARHYLIHNTDLVLKTKSFLEIDYELLMMILNQDSLSSHEIDLFLKVREGRPLLTHS